MTKQTQTFQAETKELLNLMIHSLYSHKEVFLRELVSNASDAIEKLKFEGLTQPHLASLASDSEIRIEPNAQARTLSITDSGIGMSYEEVIENIGTIAHSGTKSFAKINEKIKENPELIGQFGVGFYSAFMVADHVTVETQKAGSPEGVLWESDGQGTYSIEKKTRSKGHGTTITLHLKPIQKKETQSEQVNYESTLETNESQDFTDPWTLKHIIKKYSDFVIYPIKMKVEYTDDTNNTEENTTEKKTETHKVRIEDETLNSQKALWLKQSTEISNQEYSEFYRHISHDWTDPLKVIHYKAEGTFEFTSLLYIPSQKPFNYDYRDRKVGLSLYAKRIFIKSDCEELLPSYLRFVHGVVDSDDLSLNVSREILQQDRQIARIKKALTSKVLNTLKELMEADRSAYEKFWAQFGPTLKEAIPTESHSNEKIQELLLFFSSHSEAPYKLTSLKEYISRMKPEQKAIYTLTGENLNQIENSPYLEKLKVKGYEVLFMTDKIDLWMSSYLKKYNEKPFQSILSENLDLHTEEEKKQEEEKLKETQTKLKPLLNIMQEALKDQVKEIKFSDRLTESPVCLVSSENAATAHMERLMESMGQNLPKTKRILEINPNHPLYEKMLNASEPQQKEWTDILYQQALLNEGSKVENPLLYSKKIANLMIAASQN